MPCFAPLSLFHSGQQNPDIRSCFKLQHKLQRVLVTFVATSVFLVHGCQYTLAGSAWLSPLELLPPQQLCLPRLYLLHAPLAYCERALIVIVCAFLQCNNPQPSSFEVGKQALSTGFAFLITVCSPHSRTLSWLVLSLSST